MRKCFFFDRDGVLNHSIVKNGKPYSPNTLNEVKVSYYAFEIIRYLKNRNFLTIVVTNQPDVKRKIVSVEIVKSINNYLKKKLKFDDLFVCYDDKDYSFYRKPKPGMIFEAKKKWNINLSKSYIVGDRNKDIKAGLNSGLKTIFIDNGYFEKKPMFSNYKINNLQEIKKIL